MVGQAQGALEELRAHDDSSEGVYHKSKITYDEVLTTVWEKMEEDDQEVFGFYEYWGFKGHHGRRLRRFLVVLERSRLDWGVVFDPSTYVG